MTRTTKRSARRAGFTLVEMLVVTTIIAILISLTAAGVLALITTQQSFNTKTSLTRFQEDLQRAYRSAADKFRKEPIPTSGNMAAAYNAVFNMAGQDRARTQVIWTKLGLKQTFPNNFTEALNPAPLPPLSYYTTKLNALGYYGPYDAPTHPSNTTIPQYQTLPWESSVCLLWALQRGEDGPALKESDFGTGSLKDFGQIALTANNPSSGLTPLQQPVKGLVDGWGTPLFFNRWAVNSYVLNPAAPPPSQVSAAQAGDKNDAEDPSGMLEAPSWEMSGGSFSASANQFMAWCHPLVQHTAGTPAQTFRVFPLIVSAGPDKLLGLDPTNFFALQTASQEKDNLYPAVAAPK